MEIKKYVEKKKLEKKVEKATSNLDFESAIYFDKLLKMLKQDKNINKNFLGGTK